MIQTISGNLCDPMPQNGDRTIKVVINATISKGGNYAFSRYSKATGDFLTINANPRVLIQYQEKDRAWDKHNQIVITQKNIFQVRVGFKRFYKAFQREDLYTYDESGCIDTIHCVRENLVVIRLDFGQLIRLLPDIIVDRTNIRYPGVQITLNHEENKVLLSIEEFECLLDIFHHINIFEAGLTLLQTYAIMQKHPVMEVVNQKEAERSKPIVTGNGSIFEKKHGAEQCNGPPLVNKPKTLDDL